MLNKKWKRDVIKLAELVWKGIETCKKKYTYLLGNKIIYILFLEKPIFYLLYSILWRKLPSLLHKFKYVHYNLNYLWLTYSINYMYWVGFLSVYYFKLFITIISIIHSFVIYLIIWIKF